MASLRIIMIFVLILSGNLSGLYSGENELLDKSRKYFKPLPQVFESAKNPITPEKVELGKMLFYDTRISVDTTVSCFKCHWINLYGTDALPKAIGNHYKLNPRNSPTVLNAAGQISEHWIGNRKDVEDQAKLALTGGASYGLPSLAAGEKKLRAIPGYLPLFQKAFPGEENPVTVDNFAKAVGAFERTLTTPSRFDQFLEGDTGALTLEEKQGLRTFMDTGCIGCHNGPLVGGDMYQKFGITEPYWKLTGSKTIDPGRFAVTGDSSDLYVFKVPMLRNVEMTGPWFHDGSVTELRRAVIIMAKLQLGKNLDSKDAEKIVTFLNALTGTIPAEGLKVPILPPAR